MPAATTASRFCFILSGGAALSAHSPRRAPFGCPAVGYPLQSLPERLLLLASTLSYLLKFPETRAAHGIGLKEIGS